jgi:hypothetical protein
MPNFVIAVRELNLTSHFAKNDRERRYNLDGGTTLTPGYAVSLSRPWLSGKGFGGLKQTHPLRQVKLLGLRKVNWFCIFSLAAHNLIRLPSDGSITGDAQTAVCLSGGCGPWDASLRPGNPYRYWPRLQFKQISIAQIHKSPGDPLQYPEF